MYPTSDSITDAEVDSWRRQFEGRLEDLEARLPKERRRVLDIGAGRCSFIYIARERGWDVLGIEPSEQGKFRAESLSLPFVNDFFSPEVMEGRGRFDLIHANCVLEHVLNPIELIETAFDNLAPGGLLSICVPNDFNPLQSAFVESRNRDPWWVVPLQHINYFDTKSLPGLLERFGFEIEKVEPTFPIELFLLFGDDYVSDSSLGGPVHRRVEQFESSMKQAGKEALLDNLYEAFGKLGFGRRILVTAERP